MDSRGLAAAFDVDIYVTFAYSFDRIFAEHFDAALLVVFLVRGEIFLIGTDVYHCSQIGKPGITFS